MYYIDYLVALVGTKNVYVCIMQCTKSGSNVEVEREPVNANMATQAASSKCLLDGDWLLIYLPQSSH